MEVCSGPRGLEKAVGMSRGGKEIGEAAGTIKWWLERWVGRCRWGVAIIRGEKRAVQ